MWYTSNLLTSLFSVFNKSFEQIKLWKKYFTNWYLSQKNVNTFIDIALRQNKTSKDKKFNIHLLYLRLRFFCLIYGYSAPSHWWIFFHQFFPCIFWLWFSHSLKFFIQFYFNVSQDCNYSANNSNYRNKRKTVENVKQIMEQMQRLEAT